MAITPKRILNLYVDESGTPPLNDRDEPFVAVAVGRVGNHLALSPFPPSFSHLCTSLAEQEIILGITSVKPCSGYHGGVTAQFAALRRMTRDIAAFHRGTPKYQRLDREASPRNWVWINAIHQAVGPPFLAAIERAPITGVQFFLDSKSLSDKHRRFVEDSLRNEANIVSEYLAENPDHPAELQERLLARARASAKALSVHWIAKNSGSAALDGIKAADVLARRALRDFLNNTNEVPLSLSEVNLATKCYMDITDRLMAPVADETVALWKSLTGQ